MRKKAYLALMLALALLLSGCALIVKDQAVDDATVILKMGEKTVTKAQVLEEAENQLNSMEYYYLTFGQPFDRTDASIIRQARESAVVSLKRDMALTAKAAELGMDQLTPEEEEAAQTSAKESWDGAIEQVKLYDLADSGLDGEALDQKAAETLEQKYGVTQDTYLEAARRTTIDNKLRAYAIEGVEVTDDEVKAEYEKRVESDKSLYGELPASYAMAVNNGTTVYYVPAGVRRVKQILIKFKEEDQAAIDEANQALTEANNQVSAAEAKVSAAQETLNTEGITEEVKAQAEADLEAAQKELDGAKAAQEAAQKAVDDATAKAFENIDADADGVLASLEGGADWQTLMDEKNEDPGMKDNEKGYAVAADLSNFDPAFVAAAMALEKPGDVSPKTKGIYGYYIIRYDSDEPEGPVALDDVKESLSASLLTTKQNEVYTEKVNQWVEEAGITVDMNSLND